MSPPRCAGPRRGRRILLLAACGGLLALPFAACWALPAALERAIPIAARRAGIEPLALEVHSARWDRLELRDLHAGPSSEIRIGRLVLEYTPRGLLEGRLDRIAAADLRVRATLDEGSFPLSALGTSGSGGGAPIRLPALAIESARLELRSPLGTFEAELDAELEGRALRAAARVRSADDRLRGHLELEPAGGDVGPVSGGAASDPAIRVRGRLGLALGDLSVPGWIAALSAETELAFAMELDARGAALRLEECGPLRVSRAALPGGAEMPWPIALCVAPETAVRVRRDPDAAPERRLAVESAFELREIRLPDLDRPPPPLTLTGSLDSRNERVDFRARLRDAGEALVLEAEGLHALADSSGEARIRLLPIRFEPDGLQPGDLLPLAGRELSSVSGTLGLEGALRWSPGDLESPFEIRAEQLSFDFGEVRIERLDAAVQLDRLWPPSTPPRQRVRVARLDSGLAFTDGELLFTLQPDARLAIERLAWRAAGGRLTTRGIFDPKADRQQLTWRVEDVDLARLLEAIDLEGLSGTGTLAGELPVTIEGNRVRIRDGQLTAAAPGGWIRYRPSGVPDLPLGEAQGLDLDLVRRVLENFGYQRLLARIDGEATEEIDVEIELGGANPDVYDGHPVELNLDLEGLQIGHFLRVFSLGTRLPEALATRRRRSRAR